MPLAQNVEMTPDPPSPSRGTQASAGSTATDVLGGWSRFGLVAFSAVYGVGVLIVNIDLGRSGTFNLDLARPEYVLAGALWMSAVTSATWGVLAAHRGATRKWQQPHTLAMWGWLLFWPLVMVLGGPVAILVAAQYGRGLDLPWWHFYVAVAILSATAVFVTAAVKAAKDIVGAEPFLPQHLFAGYAVAAVPYLGVILGSLAMYATLVFPYIPKEFGGGSKTVVRVVLTESPPASWAELGFAVSVEQRTIGPVALLLDTGGMLYVRRVEDGMLGWAKTSALALDKRIVSHIIFLPRPWNPPKPAT